MINKIVKSLKNNSEVSGYKVNEINTITKEAFYVLGHLETTRMTDTTDYQITVYHNFEENSEKYTGSYTFFINHKMSSKEIDGLVEEAKEASKLVKNKYYELPKQIVKRSFKEKGFNDEPFILMDKIANIFYSKESVNAKFNALEIFLTETNVHFVNSNGINMKKKTYKAYIEAIPSYNGETKVELYKIYNYQNIDFDKINEDAKNAIEDVESRYKARKLEGIKNCDVILQGSEVGQFFSELIQDYSYASIYRHNTDKVIGDMIQNAPKGDLININLTTSSKANLFDSDGIMLKETKIIENGKIVNYFGDNQNAYYLNISPTGRLNKIKVKKGKIKNEKMMSKPHLKIIALSAIQIDIYSGYIGGEVRLANYFDGKNNIPVSGFSFSGDINKCLENLSLSCEIYNDENYEGPKYIKLINMEVL